MKREEIFAEINRIREEQDKLWPRDERRKQMYSFIPPHIILLDKNVSKIKDEWYASKSEDCYKRILTIAALAIRALEEITPYE
jgi:hypothetical protein